MSLEVIQDVDYLQEYLEKLFCTFYEVIVREGFGKELAIKDKGDLPSGARDAYEAAWRLIAKSLNVDYNTGQDFTDRLHFIRFTIFVFPQNPGISLEFDIFLNHPPARIEKKLEAAMKKARVTVEALGYKLR